MSLPRPLKWHTECAVPQADRIPSEIWEEHKDVLHEKYAEMKLAELMAWMERNNGFVATPSQYNHQFERWGLRKRKRKTSKMVQDSPATASSPCGQSNPSPSSTGTASETQRHDSLASSKRLKTSSPLSEASKSMLQVMWREGGHPGDSGEVSRPTPDHPSDHLLDTTQDTPSASVLDEPAPSANILPKGVTEEVQGVGDSYIPTLPQFASLPSRLDDLEDLADFFFNLGLYEEAFPCYTVIWSQAKKSASGPVKLLAEAACVRSATTPSQLEWMIKRSPELEQARYAIQRAVEFGSRNLNVDKIEAFLNVMLVLEAQNRTSGTASPRRIQIPRDPQLIHSLLELPYNSRPTEFLVSYYIGKPGLPRLYELWSSGVTKCHFQGTLGGLSLTWASELRRLLGWCKSRLEHVIPICCDYRLLKYCEVEEDMSILKAALYCLLWTAYKSLDSQLYFANIKEKMGFSAAQLFRAVAALAANTVPARLHAMLDALPGRQGGDSYISLAPAAIAIVLQLPMKDLAYAFLEKLVCEEPLGRKKDNAKMKEKLRRRCWATIKFNMDALPGAVLRSTVASPVGKKCDSNLDSEDDTSTRNNRKDQGKVLAQKVESPICVLADGGSQCKQEEPLPMNVQEYQESRFGTEYRGNTEIEKQDAVFEQVAEMRNSMASRESRYTWTKSLRSSDRSFGSFKALRDRCKQYSRLSRSSENTPDSFISFLEYHVNRLSDRLSIMSFASGEQEQPHSRDSSAKMATMVMDKVDERDEAVMDYTFI